MIWDWVADSDGSGSKFFELGQVGSIIAGRVRLGQPFMVWVWIWKISSKNVKFFNFFPFGLKKFLRVGSKSTGVKGGTASYLLRVKSKLGSGWVGSGPISSYWWIICYKFAKIQSLLFLYWTKFDNKCIKNLKIWLLVTLKLLNAKVVLVAVKKGLVQPSILTYIIIWDNKM